LPVLKANDDDDEKNDDDVKADSNNAQENTTEQRPSKRQAHNFINEAVEHATPATVQILFKNIIPDTPNPNQQLTTVSAGSGFIVSADGLILTTAHATLLYNGDHVVRLADGREHTARVLKVDNQSDLALWKIDSVSSKTNIYFLKFYLKVLKMNNFRKKSLIFLNSASRPTCALASSWSPWADRLSQKSLLFQAR
jgi:S1-C subfamily serine protease